jgi:hypothetical protein
VWGGGGLEGNLCPRFLFLHVGGFKIKPPTHATRSGVRATSAPPASFLLLQILALLLTSARHFLHLPATSYIFQTLATSARQFLLLPDTCYICQSLPTSARHFLHLSDTSYICQPLPTSSRRFLHLPATSYICKISPSFHILHGSSYILPDTSYICQTLSTSVSFLLHQDHVYTSASYFLPTDYLLLDTFLPLPFICQHVF